MQPRFRSIVHGVVTGACLTLFVACGGGDGQGGSRACGGVGTHSHPGDDGQCYCDEGYDWANPDDQGDNRCRSTAAQDVTSPDAVALDDVLTGPDATTDAPASPEVVTPTACVTAALCADASDCQQGERCNLMLQPPKCQKLYCATVNQACDPTQGDVMCVQGLTCALAPQPYCCKVDCDQRECGGDGCGGLCGGCSGAQETCEDGTCVCQPACEGKVCGDDGCGGLCGTGACTCGQGDGNEAGVGKPCTTTDECGAGMVCTVAYFADMFGEAGFCTKECGTSADCGSQARCCDGIPFCVLDSCAAILTGFSCEPR